VRRFRRNLVDVGYSPLAVVSYEKVKGNGKWFDLAHGHLRNQLQMHAFRRLDHLLCDVPDIDAAFDLFTKQLGFPVAWPIGRYWPHGRTCGVGLGGINLEFIQPDSGAPSKATIRGIAFEPTDRIQEIFDREGIPYATSEKWESNDELLALRSMPTGQGAQLLCTNTMPAEYAIEFPFFACKYSVVVTRKLQPLTRALADGNMVEQVFLGHPDPSALKQQIGRFGIQEGVRLAVIQHSTKEVVAISMRTGPVDLGGWPAGFEFIKPS
jgi:hypothetical protein